VDPYEFEITVTEDAGFLRVTLSGAATRVRLHRALERIIDEAKSKNNWRLLIDIMAVPPPISTVDKYETGVEVAHLADRRLRMAVVGRVEIVDHFFETVARNRGASVRAFTEEAEALDWLREGSRN
jgi:hypothetical protein